MVDRVTGFPPGTVLDELVQAADAMKELGQDTQRVTVNDPLRVARDELDALSKVQAQALQDAVKASGLASKFSYASTVSGYLTGASTIISGIYLYQKGNDYLGGQLVVSGVIQLVNTAISSKGFWVPVARVVSFGNRNMEQILAPALPFVITILTSLWNGHIIMQLSGDQKTIVKHLEQITSIFNLCVSLGNVVAKLNQGVADRALMEINTKMGILDARVSQLLRQRDYGADARKRIGDGLRDIVTDQIDRTSRYTKN